MTEFLELNSLKVFFNKFKEHFGEKKLNKKKINFENSRGRIVSEDIKAKENLPPFSRSTVDGFAVKAEDTAGASASLPAYLEVVGKIEMGEDTNIKISSGQAVAIPTGGMMPEGADAVLMVEYTEYLDENTIESNKAVAAGENVVLKGEDIKFDEVLFTEGHKIRARDIGAMAALGVTELNVYERPEIAVISTGDEIIKPGDEATAGEIRDINSYSISSFINSYGAKANRVGIVKDEFELLKKSIKSNLDSDLILISGGSSVGIKDMTIDLLNSLGEPGVLLHGLSIKPGKPTIFAVIEGTPVIGLPGHPASAWTVTKVLVTPLLKFLLGELNIDDIAFAQENYRLKAKLSRNIVSDKGREEYIPVKLIKNDKEDLIAKPLTGKSSLITTLVNGDGLIKIKSFEEGKNKGDMVKIEMI